MAATMMFTSRALRSQANQALDNTRPVVENGVEEASKAAEHVRKVTVRYWRENGYRDSRQALRDVQEVCIPSNSITACDQY